MDSQLQSELKSLKKVHENLGKQASSLGAELAQTRDEAYQLKYQLEDATSRLTSPSRSEAPSASPVAAPASSSPEVVGSPFGVAIHEDILALQAQIDLLTSDIALKNEALETMQSARAADALTAHSESERLRTLVSKTKQEAEISEAEAKHCIKQVQSGKEAALVAAATAASDAKVLATRCASLEVTVARLMEGLENKDKVKSDMEEAMKKLQLSRDVDINELYSVKRPFATDLASGRSASGTSADNLSNNTTEESQASDCEAKLVSDGNATEGMDTASSAITGPLAAGLATTASEIIDNNKQKASSDFIPAVHSSNDNTDENDVSAMKSSRLSVVGNGRSFSRSNINATAPGTNKAKPVMIKTSSNATEDAIVAGKKPSKRGKGNIFEEFGFLKNDAVKLVVKGAAGLILLGVLTRLIRGGTNRSKTKARSHHSLQAAATGAASFVHA